MLNSMGPREIDDGIGIATQPTIMARRSHWNAQHLSGDLKSVLVMADEPEALRRPNVPRPPRT
jgi:hypothetical protein